MSLFKLLKTFRPKKQPDNSCLSNLEKYYALSKEDILSEIKQSLIDKSYFSADGQLSYKELGGANNYGFALYNSKKDNSAWITKIAPNTLQIREALFYEYHEKFLNEKSLFAPKYIGYDILEKSELGILTIEKLNHAKNIYPSQIFDLFSRYEQGKNLFNNGLLNDAPKLKSGTIIRDIIVNLVCDFNSSNAESYINNFFLERIEKLPKHINELVYIQSEINKHYKSLKNIDKSLIGFVHGDFKPSNIMVDSKNQLRLIDFQYYCQGVRVWDLAFFFSKNKKPFSKSLKPFLKENLTENEMKYLLFFYIFSVLLHAKPSALKQKKCRPALDYLNSLMSKEES